MDDIIRRKPPPTLSDSRLIDQHSMVWQPPPSIDPQSFPGMTWLRYSNDFGESMLQLPHPELGLGISQSPTYGLTIYYLPTGLLSLPDLTDRPTY